MQCECECDRGATAGGHLFANAVWQSTSADFNLQAALRYVRRWKRYTPTNDEVETCTSTAAGSMYQHTPNRASYSHPSCTSTSYAQSELDGGFFSLTFVSAGCAAAPTTVITGTLTYISRTSRTLFLHVLVSS